MKIQLQQLDVPNKNGRIYPKVTMQEAIDKANTRPTAVLGTVGLMDNGMVDLTKVAFMTKDLRIEDGFLVCEAEPLNTYFGGVYKKMLENPSSIAYRTAGVGKVDENGVVSDFEISYISIIPANDAA